MTGRDHPVGQAASQIDPRSSWRRHRVAVTACFGRRNPNGEDPLKAIVRDRYGSPDVLELRDIAKPVAKDDEVLVRVRASSVNTADIDYLR